MASLTLKNIPDELLSALRERAARERRSMTQEIFMILERELTSTAAADAKNRTSAALRAAAGSWSDMDDDEAREILRARTEGRAVDW